jgi:hypothetical protein
MLASFCAVLLAALGALVMLVDAGTVGAFVAGVVATPVVAVVVRSADAFELGERRGLKLHQELRDELLHARE